MGAEERRSFRNEVIGQSWPKCWQGYNTPVNEISVYLLGADRGSLRPKPKLVRSNLTLEFRLKRAKKEIS